MILRSTARHLFFVLVGLVLLAGTAERLSAVEGSWSPVGPPGSQARHLVAHPRNPQILWAGTANAGVFKSVDGGATWRRASRGLSEQKVVALAVAPSDPDTLYAAVAGLAGTITGVFQSADGGGTWTARLSCPPHPLSGTGCLRLQITSELAVDPRNPRVVYAATSRGVFKSVNGGVRWDRTGRNAFQHQTYALAIDPRNPRIVYAGGADGVSKSENGGATWVAWSSGIGHLPIHEIVIDPADPRRIWAGGSTFRGVFRTTNGGARWRRAESGIPARHVSALALSPSASGLPTVWAGTERGLYRSRDGGVTWAAVAALRDLVISDLAASPGGSVQAVGALSFRPDRVPGIYRSGDAGATWQLSNRGLFGLLTRDLAFDPSTPGVLWVASLETGVFRSTNRGATWTRRNSGLERFGQVNATAVEVDPRDPETVWISTYEGPYVTEDAGATWQRRSEGLFPPGDETTPSGTFPFDVLRIAPADSSSLYGAAVQRLFRTRDAGASWTQVRGPFSERAVEITDVLVDERDPEAVFVAAGEVWVSRDGGSGWTAAAVGSSRIRALVADPRDPDVLFAGGDEGLFRSADGGQNWQRVAAFPAVPISEMAIGPTGFLWAGGEEGIYVSPDDLSLWVPAPGIEPFPLQDLEVDPHTPETAFAATAAGVFRHGD